MPTRKTIKEPENIHLVTLLSWKVISLLGRARSKRLLHDQVQKLNYEVSLTVYVNYYGLKVFKRFGD